MKKLNDIRLVDKLNEIKVLLKTGQISYEEAKKEASPLIAEMNAISLRVAKKLKVNPKYITFTGFMR